MGTKLIPVAPERRTMACRVLLVAIVAACLSGAAAAQTQPTIPPASAPQIAPGPAAKPAVLPAAPSQLQSEFAVAVGDTVMFPYQSKDLTARSLKVLDNQAKWLIARPDVKVTLEAYCDDDIEPARAQEFCMSRAREVRDYLVRQGVASERISLVAFDDTQAPRKPPATKPDATKPDAPKPGTRADVGKPAATKDASKPETAATDARKDKSARKDEKARRTNRRVATRVST
jgi:peptidoglycan-associated lipoprotein